MQNPKQTTRELASEVEDLFQKHAPHLQAGIRYTNGHEYIIVRKRFVAYPANQLLMFEGSQKL